MKKKDIKIKGANDGQKIDDLFGLPPKRADMTPNMDESGKPPVKKKMVIKGLGKAPI